MSAACPKCGFDLEAGKPCRVCGYLPNAAAVSAAPVAAASSGASAEVPFPRSVRPASRRRRPQGPVLIIASASVGLLAVVGVFILGDLRSPGIPLPVLKPLLSASPKAVPDPRPPAPDQPAVPTAAAADHRPAATPPAAAVSATLAQASTTLSESEPPFDITSRIEQPPTQDRASYVRWMLAHTDEKEKFLLQKWALTQSMISFKSVTHPRVLEAMLLAPREFFCRDARRAYEDAVLPIGYGQTISGPHMVARMTDYLDPQPDQRVLEIGTGSGYQSSVLAELSNHVYTVEIVEPLARETDAIYRARESHYPEYRNVHRRLADGYYGWPEEAPFDRIIVTCGIDHVPPELLRELAPEGIMVIPVGPPSGQTILRIVKHVAADGSVTLDREDIFHGKKRQIFVPFRSGQGGVHVQTDMKETK